MSRIDGGLRNLFQTHLKTVHWTPVETGGTAMGVPDLNGCESGVEVWIELKKADHWVVGNVRAQQVSWIERRMRKGGRVFVAVRRAGSELWLLSGAAARPLIDGSRLDDLSPLFRVGVFEGGPARWPWPKIHSLLGF